MQTAKWILGLVGLGLGAGSLGVRGEVNPLFAETFQVVWETIRDAYYDPGYHGNDWEAVREGCWPAVEAADDVQDLRQVLRAMLEKLGQSHFALLEEEPAWLGTEALGGPRGTLGITWGMAGEAVVVRRVERGSAAERAGIRPGWELVEAGRRPVAEAREAVQLLRVPAGLRKLYFLRAVEGYLATEVGKGCRLVLADGTGEAREVFVQAEEYRGRWSAELANMPSGPLETELAWLEDGTAYLRFSLFALELMPEIRAHLEAAAERGARGMIFDLRGNPGGVGYMAPAIAGFLLERQWELGVMRMRTGEMRYVAFPQPAGFRGPVAVLVDGTSVSTSEILAAGLQEAGRAQVFGERTAGAVLPSLFKPLPTGDTLQYVVADFVTGSGVVLEGRGVQPDVEVPLRREELLEGRDRALEEARSWIAKREKMP